MKNNNLIYNKYTFSDIVDIEQLTKICEKFSKSTNFTIGLVDNNTLELLIKTGWHDICVNFHRADEEACKICKKSNKILFENLEQVKSVKIVECEHGLYDCATPIIFEGKHVANLVTGQLLMQKPDRKRFEKQAEVFGFNKKKYLAALDKVPIISEEKVKEIMDYLSELAVFIAETGLTKIKANELNKELIEKNQELESSSEEIQAVDEQLSASFDAIKEMNTELMKSNNELVESQIRLKNNETKLKEKNQELRNSSEEIRAADEQLTASFDAIKEMNEELMKSNSELVESQIRLKNNETILKEAQKIANLGHWKLNLITNNLTWSDEVYRIFNLKPQELGASYEVFLNNIHPEDRDKVNFAYTNSLKTKQPYEIEHRLLLKNGGIKYVLEKCNTDFDEKGNPICSIGTVLDITESKKIEKKLKKQNDDYLTLNEEYIITNDNLQRAKEKAEIAKEQYENITRSTLDIIFIVDKFGKMLFLNDRVENILDYKAKDLIGKSFTNFTPKKEIPRYFVRLKDVFLKKEIKNFNTYILHKSGKLIDVEINGKLIRYKGKLAGQGTMRDISERKISEQKLKKQNEEYAALNEEYKTQNEELIKSKERLKESEAKFKNIFEYAPLGIIIFDTKGNPININKQVLKILGSGSIEQTKQVNALEFKNLKKVGFPEVFNKCIEEKKIIEGETFYETKWSKHRYIRYILTPILDNENLVTGVLSIYEDFTDRQKAEQDLIIAKEQAEESDRLKTEFLNNMSHEIRTPMNGILGFSDLLKKRGITIEKQTQYINIIQSSGNQLLRIIDDILEISRLGTKQVQPLEKKICLNDMLLDLFSVFDIKAKEQQIPLYLKKGLSDDQSTIHIDETRLRKILSNLLENALKFTSSGFIELAYELKNSNLEIYVKDTGIGIDEDKHSVIFNRFSQADKGLSRKFGGLGLGLSIAKENAELLGGEISLKSKKGEGAIFTVKIPYKPVNPKAIKQIHKHTVLIVEDEEINSLYLDTMLEELDFDIKTIHAKNGKEAVDVCKQDINIDLVLMDLKMPIMNGYEATTEIKKNRPSLPIIAQTAYTTRVDKDKAMQAGCNDFISKPIREEVLKNIIKKYIK